MAVVTIVVVIAAYEEDDKKDDDPAAVIAVTKVKSTHSKSSFIIYNVFESRCGISALSRSFQRPAAFCRRFIVHIMTERGFGYRNCRKNNKNF